MAVIEVDNVWKRYNIGLVPTIWHQVPHLWPRRNGRHPDDGNDKAFWALKGVSLKAERGEILGIIGPNGAGKTTLLRILCGVTQATTGRISVSGRMAPLIEVGAGFQQELTGRDNIYLNAAILGMSRAEINRKFDDIVAFSELADFMDTPVKKYSSGMIVRLGFSVAAHMDPDVLLVDEVLAVGDARFYTKCLEKVRSLVSPNPPMRSGLGVGTRGEGRGTRRSALDSDKWGRWRPLVGVGGADGGPGQRRWGGVGGTACKGRQSRTGPVRLCGVVE